MFSLNCVIARHGCQLNKHNFKFDKVLFDKLLFGFRENHSTALTEFVERKLSNFDKGNAICAVFFNLSKAFNSVDRKILLRKLECYGVRGNMHLLIKSYLDGMKQFVSFGGYESICEKSEVGIPQG